MFKHLVWISAIGVALCAALFSVTGIATLFSAKFWAVVAMASALELGKLVMASYLYRWWKNTPKLLKTYAIAAVAILMVITSIGIYGYLSAAYAEVAAVPQNTLNEITAIDTRQASLNSTINRLQSDNETLDARREQAQRSLDNVLAGETNLSQRSAFANLRQEVADLDDERQANNERIEAAVAERDSLENVKVGLNAELNVNSDIGPFIYIARTTNLPLDTVVKWFVLMIVFVFDPLAISLILAYNNIVVKEKEGFKGRDPGMESIMNIFKGREMNDEEREAYKRVEERLFTPVEEKKDPIKEAAAQTRKFVDNLPDDLVDADLGSDWPEKEDEIEPVNLDEEEPDVIDFDSLRNIKALENITDLSHEIEFDDEWEEDEEDWFDWTPPLEADGRITMSVKEGKLPDPSWDLNEERSAISRDSAPTQSLDAEEDTEILEIHDEPRKEPINRGWSLSTKKEFPHDMPFYERPGYDWKRREKEWKRNPKAVEYYETHVKPNLTNDEE